MTIDAVDDLSPLNQYVASAAQDEFDYDFPIFEEADLVVDVDGVTQALDTDYTVANEGANEGGTITFVTPLDGGEVVTIYRDIPIARSSEFQQNGPWGSLSTNAEFNRIIMMLQQLEANHGRALRWPKIANVASADLELTPLANWLSKYVFINANGEPEPADFDGSGTPISQSVIGNLLYPQSAAELAAGITPTNIYRNYGDVFRYGATGDGVTDDTTALQAALTLSRTHPMYLPPLGSDSLYYKITDELIYPGSGAHIIGSGYLSMIRQATVGAGCFARAAGGTTIFNMTTRDVYVGVSGNITAGTAFDLEGISQSKFYNCWVIADSALQGYLVGFRNHTTNDSNRYSILNAFSFCGARTAVSASARAFICSGASGTSSNSHRVHGGDWQADDGKAFYVPNNGGGAGGVSTQNTVEQATFEGDTAQAVHIEGGSNVSQGNGVSFCRFENGAGNNGILLDTGTTCNTTEGNLFASGLTNKLVDSGEFNYCAEASDQAGALIRYSRGSFRGVFPSAIAFGIFDALVAAATTNILAGAVSGDTVARVAMDAAGKLSIGPGNAPADIIWERIAAGVFGPSTGRLGLKGFTVGTLPAVASVGQFIYVLDEAGGPVPAFSDGTNWRRVTDRAIVS